MQVLVVSDSHGRVDNMIQAVERVQPDYVLHLGDCQRDLEKLRREFPGLPMEGRGTATGAAMTSRNGSSSWAACGY